MGEYAGKQTVMALLVIEFHVRKSALFDESPDFVAGVGSDSPYVNYYFDDAAPSNWEG